MYKVLTKDQILALYPGQERKIEKLLPLLIKQYRIWKVDGYYCSSPDAVKNMDRSLLLAVWVLIDFIDRISFHSVGDFPAKIIFCTDGSIYEILYAGIGQETLISYLTSTQNQSGFYHLIMVDKPEQIPDLDIPNTCGYCTVSLDGKVQYYQKGEAHG